MSNKQQKKLRQLVRRNQRVLVEQSWDVFFETMRDLPFKYRLKMAWKIITKRKIRDGINYTRATANPSRIASSES